MKFLFLGISLLVASSSLASSEKAVSSHTLRIRLSADADNLDWNKASYHSEKQILSNLMEGLLELDGELKIQNRLAQSVQFSPDGKIITFTLRQGVVWQDGVPLKAADFVYSWKRLLSPLTASRYAHLLFDLIGAKEFNSGKLKDFGQVGVKAIDDRRIEVRLTDAVPDWIFIPTFWPLFPLREDVVEKNGNAWASPGKMITLGPYTLESREVGSKIVLRENPKYWGKRGNVAQIEAIVVNEDAAAMALFEAGQFDLIEDLSPADYKKWSDKLEIKKVPLVATDYLAFRVDKYPVSLESLRRALAHSVDVKAIAGVEQGLAEPATGLIPPSLNSGARKKPVRLEFDPLRARSLLRMSGIDPAELNLDLLISKSARNRRIGEAIRDQLKKNLGVTLNLKEYDQSHFRSQLDFHAFPAFLARWGADYPSPQSFLDIFIPSSGFSRTGWMNPKYNRLTEEARRTARVKSRMSLFESAEQLLIEKNVVIIPLFYESTAALVSRRTQGVRISPLNFLYLRDVSLLPSNRGSNPQDTGTLKGSKKESDPGQK